MSLYESVFIARQDIPTTQVDALTASFTDIIQAGGGKVTKTESWGLRTLAYKINKNRKGHYVLMNIDAPAAAVAEMERNMGHNEDILRVLTIKMDELEEGPSVMMQSRDRGDRDGRGEGRGRRYDGPDADSMEMGE
jgi:small subunit ribosomal protein S6